MAAWHRSVGRRQSGSGGWRVEYGVDASAPSRARVRSAIPHRPAARPSLSLPIPSPAPPPRRRHPLPSPPAWIRLAPWPPARARADQPARRHTTPPTARGALETFPRQSRRTPSPPSDGGTVRRDWRRLGSSWQTRRPPTPEHRSDSRPR